MDEPRRDIAPTVYEVRQGAVVHNEQYPDVTNVPPKTAGFMKKMADFLRTPTPYKPKPGSIEKEVEDLQK